MGIKERRETCLLFSSDCVINKYDLSHIITHVDSSLTLILFVCLLLASTTSELY